MGQAKLRGTREQRVAQAEERIRKQMEENQRRADEEKRKERERVQNLTVQQRESEKEWRSRKMQNRASMLGLVSGMGMKMTPNMALTTMVLADSATEKEDRIVGRIMHNRVVEIDGKLQEIVTDSPDPLVHEAIDAVADKFNPQPSGGNCVLCEQGVEHGNCDPGV